MEGLAVTGFVFGLSGVALGVMAMIRLKKLVQTLKDQGVLAADYTEE